MGPLRELMLTPVWKLLSLAVERREVAFAFHILGDLLFPTRGICISRPTLGYHIIWCEVVVSTVPSYLMFAQVVS
jgi:hypothetical protein